MNNNTTSGSSFSCFKKPVNNVIPAKQLSLVEVYHLIKGAEFASYSNILRDISDTKDARKFKVQIFDYVAFSGTFSKGSVRLKPYL